MPGIFFSSHRVKFTLKQQRKISEWLHRCARRHRRQIGELSYVFCSDSYLLRLNIEFLKHRTLTDIITFDMSENDRHLSGEIYISIHRVRENGRKFGCGTEHELRRVMVHGLLHLAGFTDKSTPEKEAMRREEDACLSLWK